MCKLCKANVEQTLCSECDKFVGRYAVYKFKPVDQLTAAALRFVMDADERFFKLQQRGKWVPEVYIDAMRQMYKAMEKGEKLIKPTIHDCRECGKDFVRKHKEWTCKGCKQRAAAFRSQLVYYNRSGSISAALDHHIGIYSERHKKGLHVPQAFYTLLEERYTEGKKVPEWYADYRMAIPFE